VTAPLDRRTLAYLLLGVAFIVVGAALLLLWNRSLRVRVASRTADLRDAMEQIAKHARTRATSTTTRRADTTRSMRRACTSR